MRAGNYMIVWDVVIADGEDYELRPFAYELDGRPDVPRATVDDRVRRIAGHGGPSW